jgi:hypothetical protein
MSDPHYENVSLLLPMNGADNGILFPDLSPSPKTITRFGDTKTVTAQSKYYGSSGYFDGDGDYLSLSTDCGFAPVITGDLTVELWIRPTSVITRILISSRHVTSATGAVFHLNSSGRLTFFYTGGSTISGITPVPVNTWSHVAVVRNGSNVKIFLNGVEDGSATFSAGSSLPRHRIR